MPPSKLKVDVNAAIEAKSKRAAGGANIANAIISAFLKFRLEQDAVTGARRGQQLQRGHSQGA
jgi:hypothetical protein|tara:strand:- start:690 stop:878 length:189 start_codon:yes stop_codon:yes gene_type:complete